MALDIFTKYATDESLENNGTWREIGGGTELLIARSGNRAYSRLLAKLFEQNKQVLDVGDDVADAKSDEIMIEVAAKTILLGWKNLQFKGKDLPFSVENAKMLLAIKDFRRQVIALSESQDNYRLKEEVAQGEA